MFSCNPINRICIYATNTGYLAKEIARKGKNTIRIIEQCTGKHDVQTAKDQFVRMGYKKISIITPVKK